MDVHAASKYKLLLIQPPIQDFYDTDIRLQPVGLCSLKAAVHKFLPEFQVHVNDYHHGWGRKTIPLPPEFTYLKDYYAFPDKSPFSTFHQYYHFGVSFEEIANNVAAHQPDIVGISSLFSPYFREVIRCAQAIKARLNVPIIVGGSHVSADPESLLRHDCIDFAIRGEGERALVELLQAWRTNSGYEHVPNLGFKRDGKLVFNPIEPNYPLDDLPAPDFSDFPPERYLFEARPLSFVVTSRGCPYHCSFCSVHLTFGQGYRTRSIDAVFQEIIERYAAGYRVFDFEDDNLTFDADRMKRLCEKLIAHFPAGSIALLAMNGLSYQDLTPELLELMRRAGFSHLNLSLVSANADTRKQTRRPHSLDQYLRIVRKASQLGFQMVSYQILGLPQEPIDAMIDTLALNAGLPVLLGASVFYRTPNSPIAHEFPACSEHEMFSARSTAMAIETPHCTRDDLFTLFITSRMLNFLKGFRLAASSTPLADALNVAEKQDRRSAIGVTILRELFAQRMLYAAVGSDFKPIPRFNADLFFRVWSRLQNICTQEGFFLTDLHTT